jgi:hypothetical protein
MREECLFSVERKERGRESFMLTQAGKERKKRVIGRLIENLIIPDLQVTEWLL